MCLYRVQNGMPLITNVGHIVTEWYTVVSYHRCWANCVRYKMVSLITGVRQTVIQKGWVLSQVLGKLCDVQNGVSDHRCGSGGPAGGSSNTVQVLLWHRESRMASHLCLGKTAHWMLHSPTGRVVQGHHFISHALREVRLVSSNSLHGIPKQSGLNL